MASLSNINGLFDVHSTGAILFSTSHGTSGQILKSNGNAAPTWIPQSDIVGDYLPLSGGTLTGATATASGISFTVGGTLTGTTATFSANVGIGVAAHGTASLNITSTDQHIRLNNGSELGIINLDADGKLDLWAHGTDETISFRTGTGSGIVTMSVVGGKVGIGTTSPDAKLQVEGGDIWMNKNNAASNYYLRLNKKEGQDGGILWYRDSALDFQHENSNSSGNLSWYSYGTSSTVMTLQKSTGNLGIGTTSPGAKLDIKGDGAVSGLTFRTTDSSNNETFYINDGGTVGVRYYPFKIGVASGTTNVANSRFQIATTGGDFVVLNDGKTGIGTTSPDYLLDLSKTAVSVDTYSGINLQASNYGYTIEGGLTQNIGGELIFSSNNAGTRNERVRFAANGNVGIGTNDPQNPLHIKKEGYQLKLEDGNTTNTCEILASNNTMGFFSDRANAVASSDMIFSIDNDTKMVIDTNGNVGIGTTSPDAKLEVASDITIQNGVYTYKTGGYTSGATAINVDITVGNEGGAGNVFKIEAGFAHYFSMTYNSVAEWWCTSRGTSVVNTYILNAGTTLAGDWSASKPNTTTLRITKTAGTYGGGGKWWVKVTYVPF